MYEITFLGSGLTVYWTEEEAENHFGFGEWLEYRDNYLPNVIVVEVA